MDRAARLLDDVLAGPAELEAVIAAQRAAFPAVPREVLERPRRRLVGMGSSGFAARDAAARWRWQGHDAAAETASAWGSSRGGPGTLAIAISSSGSTPEVVAAARRHRDDGSYVVALTSRPGSALSAIADAVLPLRAARDETAGIATLTHRATVAALVRFDSPGSDGPGGRETAGSAAAAILDAGPRALAALVDGRDAWLDAAATAIDTGREVHVLGDGFATGMLEQAALMLREAPRISALPFDTGDWLHVGLYTLLPGDAVLLFAGSPCDDLAIDTIHARGARAVIVGPPPTDASAAVLPAGADVAVPLSGTDAAFPLSGTDAAVPLAGTSPDAWITRTLVGSAVPELLAAELWRRAGAGASERGR
jgi:glutamine---fructose-6-phosphate transaminase (isomerizing)